MPLLIEDVRALAAHLGFGAANSFWSVTTGGSCRLVVCGGPSRHARKLIIINAPHPTVFQRELRDNPAQQKASAYMLMFREPDAEKTLSANGHQLLVQSVLGAGLKQGHFTEADQDAYLEAWSQPGALTGGLNYYRAAQIGPPPAPPSAARPRPLPGCRA